MKDNIFIDTNIFVYAYLKAPKKEADYTKHLQAQKLLSSFTNKQSICISSQICNEYYSALLKNKIENEEIQKSLNNLIKNINVAPVSKDTILQAFEIKNLYNFSYWDSLVLSSALENRCNIIYSEDMQHKQIIEQSLQIVNPFV